MPLSDKIKDIKFTKSVAGYAVKEVDGFIDGVLPAVMEYEREVSTLRVKLDAYERRADEIAKQEKEAARLLESARAEAERIVADAKSNAQKIVSLGEGAAAEKISAAEKKAAAIISAANKKGSEIVSLAKEKSDETNEKLTRLIGEYEEFEAKFRAEVAKTVKNLAAIRESAPKVEKPKAEAVPAPKEEEPSEQKDYEFVGGKRVGTAEATKEMPRRKLYDTVTVTYDEEDDFSDIKKFLGKKEIKNPTDF